MRIVLFGINTFSEFCTLWIL